MKTKFTLNKITLLLILALTTTMSFGQSSSCAADLKVEKDRNIRSTPPDGTYYTMIITNTGNSLDTFYLSTVNINSSCSNTDGSSTVKNVDLEAFILDMKFVPINKISLNKGQSTSFLVHITVPPFTTVNNWCCTKIIAKSKSCTTYKVETVLHTLVINPNED